MTPTAAEDDEENTPMALSWGSILPQVSPTPLLAGGGTLARLVLLQGVCGRLAHLGMAWHGLGRQQTRAASPRSLLNHGA